MQHSEDQLAQARREYLTCIVAVKIALVAEHLRVEAEDAGLPNLPDLIYDLLRDRRVYENLRRLREAPQS